MKLSEMSSATPTGLTPSFGLSVLARTLLSPPQEIYSSTFIFLSLTPCTSFCRRCRGGNGCKVGDDNGNLWVTLSRLPFFRLFLSLELSLFYLSISLSTFLISQTRCLFYLSTISSIFSSSIYSLALSLPLLSLCLLTHLYLIFLRVSLSEQDAHVGRWVLPNEAGGRWCCGGPGEEGLQQNVHSALQLWRRVGMSCPL